MDSQKNTPPKDSESGGDPSKVVDPQSSLEISKNLPKNPTGKRPTPQTADPAQDFFVNMHQMMKETQDQIRAMREENQKTSEYSKTAIEKMQKEIESVKSYTLKRKNRETDDIPAMQNLDSDGSSSVEPDKKERAETIRSGEEIPSRPKGDTLMVNLEVASLRKKNKHIMKLLTQLPGAPTPMATEAIDGYSSSPFVDEIANAMIPKKLNIPPWSELYDGTSDPVDHVAQYKQRMWQLSIPSNSMEATMCKSFGATLCGPALQWLINLKPRSIANFASMVNKFYQQFASSRVLRKLSSDLYQITQKPGESTRSYLDRFNKEMIAIQNRDTPTTIEAFRRGLSYPSNLYSELTRYPCTTFEEVQTRAMAEVRIEEDEANTHQT